MCQLLCLSLNKLLKSLESLTSLAVDGCEHKGLQLESAERPLALILKVKVVELRKALGYLLQILQVGQQEHGKRVISLQIITQLILHTTSYFAMVC